MKKNKTSRYQRMSQALQMEIREHKKSFAVYASLRIAVIIMMVLQIFNRNYENVFLCVLTLLLLIVPSFVQMTFRVELPITLEIIILCFIFAAEILGEISHFYLIFPFWDTLLHTLNGFLAAAIGFSLVNLLNQTKNIQFQLSPLFVAIVAFCFSMTIGVVWEFFEFTMDTFFAMDTQKDTIIQTIHSVSLNPSGTMSTIKNISDVAINGQPLNISGYLDIGLIDTMEDLIVNFIGATVFSILGFLYIKNPNKSKLVKRFIPTPKDKNKDYLKIVNEEHNNK